MVSNEKPNLKEVSQMIRVTSKRDRFRRCGQEFTKQPLEFPDDHFSQEELIVLKKEPMLIVEVIPEDPEQPPEQQKDE